MSGVFWSRATFRRSTSGTVQVTATCPSPAGMAEALAIAGLRSSAQRIQLMVPPPLPRGAARSRESRTRIGPVEALPSHSILPARQPG